MIHALCAAIAERYPGARLEIAPSGVRARITIEDVAYRARLTMAPWAAVAVDLPSTDGFELTLQWTDRWASNGPRAPSFDDSLLIQTNDLALAAIWLDHVARSGLLASRFVAGHQPARQTAVMLRDATWSYEVANDEVCVRRRDAEPSVERMGDMLMAALLLASRPVRWARAFGVVGRELGGEPATRIEIGGKPMLRVRRGAVDVSVHAVRRLGPADPGRLRTIVGAHRHGSGGETLSLISEGLPRAAWPPVGKASPGTLAIDARAAALLDIARPSATNVRPHDVEIAFDGAISDRERLGAAIELAACWAHPGYGAGPYR